MPAQTVASAASTLLSQAGTQGRRGSIGGLGEMGGLGGAGTQSHPSGGQLAGSADRGAQPPGGAGGSGISELASAAPLRVSEASVEGEFREIAAAPKQRNDGPEAGPSASTAMRLSPPVARMPVEMSVSIPLRNFRVRDLLSARAGETIESQWSHGEDLPLSSGEVQLAWCEFEVVETRLAVRVTRLA